MCSIRKKKTKTFQSRKFKLRTHFFWYLNVFHKSILPHTKTSCWFVLCSTVIIPTSMCHIFFKVNIACLIVDATVNYFTWASRKNSHWLRFLTFATVVIRKTLIVCQLRHNRQEKVESFRELPVTEALLLICINWLIPFDLSDSDRPTPRTLTKLSNCSVQW